MKFSILTPSYGYGEFISDCVLSVLGQEGVDLEHIVMDGGSHDGTTAVLSALSDDRRLTWRSEADAGQSHALAKAFALAGGDWIGWLNADEFYLPRALAAVAEVIEASPGVDVLYGDFAEVDSAGRLLRLVTEHGLSSRTLRARCYIASCTTFIRRAAMPPRLWDQQCVAMMDWDLFLELQRLGCTFKHFHATVAAFRVHQAQVTASARAQSESEFARIRTRHNIPTTGPRLTWTKVIGRAAHVSRKVTEGGYARELRASRIAGRSLRWFDASDPRAMRAIGVASPMEAL
jgi:hypothetical protein